MRLNRIVALVGSMAFCAVVVRAEDAVLTHPASFSAVGEIKGNIHSINAHTGQIVIRDATQAIQVQIKNDTRVLDSANHSLSWETLKAGDPVIVYYRTQGKNAIEIDLQPTLADAVLGIPTK